MATYLQDVAPFVPHIETFTPDYNFLQRSLAIDQQRYDQAYNYINSSLSSIQNSDLFTTESIEKRDSYLKSATDKLKKLTEADLSLPENQAQAEKVFAPFWQDSSLVHELYVGKKINSEIQYGEGLRMSKKAEDAAMYSPDSIIDLQNFKSEYQEATPEQRLTMSPRRFTKKVDVIEEMNKSLKDLGLSGTVKETVNGGGYKFVGKNGKESVIPFYTFFKTNLSEDARNYLAMKGRVQGRSAYNNALVIAGGDKEKALDMIGEELIQNQVSSLTNTIIPELKDKQALILKRIASIRSNRLAQNSDLTEQDLKDIDENLNSLDYINKQLKDPVDTVKSLVTVDSINDDGSFKPDIKLNPQSDSYQKLLSQYRVNYGQAYGSQMIEGYAKAWASSMANFTENKIEADPAWKNIMDAQQAQAEAILKDKQKEQDNNTKLLIQYIKSGKKPSESSTENVSVNGKNIPVVVGRDPLGDGDITAVQSYDNTKKVIAQQLPMTSITLFSKMYPDLDISKSFYEKLISGIQEGKSKEVLISSNSPERVVIDNAIKSGVLKMSEGSKYTYENIYKMMLENMNNKIDSDLEINPYAYRGLMSDISSLKDLSRAYKDLEKVNAEIETKILIQPKYQGFVKIDESGRMAFISEQELEQQVIRNFEEAHPNFSKGVYNPEPGSPEAYKADLIARNLSSLKKNYLKLKSEYEQEFNRKIPSVELKGTLDAFNMGNLVYTSQDNKDNTEIAEVAVKQLLTEDTLNDIEKNVLIPGKGNIDKEVFKEVLRRVRNSVTEIDGIGVTLHPYDVNFKKESYTLNVPEDKLMSLFSVNERKDWADAIKAVKNVRIKTPVDRVIGSSPSNPEGIKIKFSMFENMVKNSNYQTDSFFDKAKIGGFKIRPLPGAGGYELSSWYYPYDPKTGKLSDQKKMDEAGTITIPVDSKMDDIRAMLFDLIIKRGDQERSKFLSNPPVPKGTGTSISDLDSKLQQLGIKL